LTFFFPFEVKCPSWVSLLNCKVKSINKNNKLDEKMTWEH
jgi:hypothetical protein